MIYEIRFDRLWVLENMMNFDKPPVNLLIDGLKELYGKDEEVLRIEKKMLNSCTIDLNDGSGDAEAKILELIEKKFGIQAADGKLVSVVKQEPEKEEHADNGKTDSAGADAGDETEMVPEEDGEGKLRLSSRKKGPAGAMPSFMKESKTKKIKSEKTASQRLDEMVGAEEYKELIREIRMVAPVLKENQTTDMLLTQTYLFAIDDGCGLSTCLDVLVQTLEELEVVSPDCQRYLEDKLPMDKEKAEIARFAAHHFSKKSTSVRLLCVDLSEWLTQLNSKEFRDFLKVVEDRPKDQMVVFRVPFLEGDALNDIANVLSDILYVRPITFIPNSLPELIEYAKKSLSRYDFQAQDDVWDVVESRIIEEKSDGRFYGMNTVDKIVKEMLYMKELYDAKNGTVNRLISQNEVVEISRNFGEQKNEALMNLKDMVGMESIEKQIEEIISQIQATTLTKQIEAPCIHMRFVGNPGTGKTTVARLVGKILKESGILRYGNFFEYSGRDFCGEYVGQTAPKTSAICRDAYGSVLFIDEAYSLYRSDDSGRDYGREALDTLIAEMENHRNDLVVVMAGYPDEMEQLMKGNPGLESRMPYLIEFPNYTKDQLADIYLGKVKGSLKYEDDFEEAVRSYFNEMDDEKVNAKEFSNGRFVRNLFERTLAKAAVRCKSEKSDEIVLKREDFRLASTERTFSLLQEKKKKSRIGF